jgi:hypothetical protein
MSTWSESWQDFQIKRDVIYVNFKLKISSLNVGSFFPYRPQFIN